MVEPATETIKVTLIDGSERECLIYKYIPFRKKQQLISKLTEGTKVNKGKDDFEVDGSKAIGIIGDLAEVVWADKNTKLDDVEGGSLYNHIQQRFDRFLGDIGFSLEDGNSQSSQTKKNK